MKITTLWNYRRSFRRVIPLFSAPETSKTGESAPIITVIGGGDGGEARGITSPLCLLSTG